MRPSTRLIDQSNIVKAIVKRTHGVLLQLTTIHISKNKESLNASSDFPLIEARQEPDIEKLLHSYANIFEKPIVLPPCRSHDHHIPLKPNALLVVIHPYPPPQKAEIDKQIGEMLEVRIIHHNNDSYSSPVIMVKKKGSWHLGIDFRAIND